MRKFFKIVIDLIAIAVGIISLVFNLTLPHTNNISCWIAGFSCWIAGLLCAVYLLYMLYLLVSKPKFDWHLIHGNFLFKVVAFVLLVPSLITLGYLYYNTRYNTVYSPKNLIYEDNLYTSENDEPDSLGVAKSNLFADPVFLRTHNLKVTDDSIIVQKGKLPESIISKQKDPSIFWTVYYHFIDPGNQHMTTSQSGRGWSALIAILGVFLLNGLLVSSIVGWIDSRKEKWLKGAVRYRWFLKLRNHYVIIGGNDIVIGIVKQIFEQIEAARNILKPYILIQTSRDVESFRRELFSTLTERQQQRIIIYYGSRISKIDIEDLCIGRAKEVYILGEDTRTDDIESYHDTMNMKCLDLMWKLYKNSAKGKKITNMLPGVQEYRKRLEACKTEEEIKTLRLKEDNMKMDVDWGNRPRLNCRVMFEYQTTFSVFQFFDLNEQMDTYLHFVPFNYYELWAQNVLINKYIEKEQLMANFQNGKYLPLEGIEGIKANDEKYVHLFIVGMSRMGVAMAIEAAHLSHYPNYEEKKIRTKITFIDKNAVEEKEFFMGRFKELFSLSHWRYGDINDNNDSVRWQMPHIPSDYEYLGGDFIDIEWEFINGGIESLAVQNYILASANPMARITIAICLPESNRSHAAALYLNKRIYESSSVLQVLAYNRYGDSIVKAINKGSSEYPFCGKLRSFGSEEDCIVCKHLEYSEEIGNHIANAYAKGEPRYAINPENSYSGKSNTANQWSNIYNGNTLWTKLRSIDLETFDNNIDILANVEHNRWNVEELLMNFRYLEENEQIEIKNGKRTKKELKKKMAHLDICSNAKLLEIDKGIQDYDIVLTKCLPAIYKDLLVTCHNKSTMQQ